MFSKSLLVLDLRFRFAIPEARLRDGEIKVSGVWMAIGHASLATPVV